MTLLGGLAFFSVVVIISSILIGPVLDEAIDHFFIEID